MLNALPLVKSAYWNTSCEHMGREVIHARTTLALTIRRRSWISFMLLITR